MPCEIPPHNTDAINRIDKRNAITQPVVEVTEGNHNNTKEAICLKQIE
jgi:hypothetical protein